MSEKTYLKIFVVLVVLAFIGGIILLSSCSPSTNLFLSSAKTFNNGDELIDSLYEADSSIYDNGSLTFSLTFSDYGFHLIADNYSDKQITMLWYKSYMSMEGELLKLRNTNGMMQTGLSSGTYTLSKLKTVPFRRLDKVCNDTVDITFCYLIGADTTYTTLNVVKEICVNPR